MESRARTLTAFVCNGPDCQHPKRLRPGRAANRGGCRKGRGAGGDATGRRKEQSVCTWPLCAEFQRTRQFLVTEAAQ